MAGCGRQEHEVAEGLALARLLRRLGPEADDLIRRERGVANQLRINLDQLGGSDFPTFAANLATSTEELTTISSRLIELQAQVQNGNFGTPLVLVVQRDAVAEFQNQISQIDTFLNLAHNIQLRAKLGRTQGFPEIETLMHQLVLFLSQPQEGALSSQIQTLKNEYRFTDNEIGN